MGYVPGILCSPWSHHPPPGWGDLVPVKTTQDMYWIVMCISWGRPGTLIAALLSLLFYLTAFYLSLHSLISLIDNCLNLPFGTQVRSRRLKPFSYKWEMEEHGRAFVLRWAQQCPAQFLDHPTYPTSTPILLPSGRQIWDLFSYLFTWLSCV